MKIRSWHILVVLGGLIVSVFVVLLLAMFIGSRPSQAVIPNPNGYDDLIQAGQLVTGDFDNASDLDRGNLYALVATNAEALRLLRVGLSRDCAVPTGTQIANFANISRDLIGLKSLAKALSAEGRLAEMDNRLPDAARSYVDSIRLGSAMSQGGLMMNRLVGIACQGMGDHRLVKLIPKLNCEDLRPLVNALEKVDQTTVSWKEVLHNENQFVRAQIGNLPNPFKYASGVLQARNMRKTSAERHELAAAHLRLLLVELALRAHRCDEGKVPLSLTPLVPKYLESVPMDPFSGKPMVYHPTGTNWILYSIGPDRTDDGGKPVGKIMSGDYMIAFGISQSGQGKHKGDLLYDSEW